MYLLSGNIQTDILFYVLVLAASVFALYFSSGPKQLRPTPNEPFALLHSKLWNQGANPVGFVTEESVSVPLLDAPVFKTIHKFRVVHLDCKLIRPLSSVSAAEFIVRDEYESLLAEVQRLYMETDKTFESKVPWNRVIVLGSSAEGNSNFLVYILCKLLLAGQDVLVQAPDHILIFVQRGVYRLAVSKNASFDLRSQLNRLGCSQRPYVLLNSDLVSGGPLQLLIEGLPQHCFFVEVASPYCLDRGRLQDHLDHFTLYLGPWKWADAFATGHRLCSRSEETVVTGSLDFGSNPAYRAHRYHNERLQYERLSAITRRISVMVTLGTTMLSPENPFGTEMDDIVLVCHPESDPDEGFLTLATRKMACQLVKFTMRTSDAEHYAKAEAFRRDVRLSKAASRMIYEGIMHYYFDQGTEVHCRPLDDTIPARTVRIPHETLRQVYVPYANDLQADTYYVAESGTDDPSFDSFILQDGAVYLFKMIQQTEDVHYINTSGLEALARKLELLGLLPQASSGKRKTWYFVFVSQERALGNAQSFEVNVPHGKGDISSGERWNALVCQCSITIQY